MDLDIGDNIRYSPSAFRHGITKEDILWALKHARYDSFIGLDETDNEFLAIGHDRSGNLLEIAYNDIDNDAIRVFHAMKCRKSYESLAEEKGDDLWPT